MELLQLSADHLPIENGYLLYQELWFKPLGKSYSGFGRISMFKTTSYQSRIYSFEHYQAYDSSVLPFYGEGSRLNFGVRFKTRMGFTIEGAFNVTKYAHQNEIGSSNDLIKGNLKSDFRFQLRYSLND